MEFKKIIYSLIISMSSVVGMNLSYSTILLCFPDNSFALESPGKMNISIQENKHDIIIENQADTLMLTGHSFYHDGKYEQALDHYGRALTLYRQCINPRKINNCLLNIGNVYYAIPNYARAIANYRDALNGLRDVDDPPIMAECKRMLGWAYFQQKEYREAIWQFDEARKIYQQLLQPEYEADCLKGKALSHLNSEQYQQAIPVFEEASTLFEQVEQLSQQARCVYYMGYSYYFADQYDQAIPNFQRSETLFRDQNDPEGRADSYRYWANSLYYLTNYREAIQQYEQAYGLYENEKDSTGMADCLSGFGNCHHELNEYQKAAQWFNQAASLYQSQHDPLKQASCLLMQGHASFNMEHYQQAIEPYQKAGGIYSQYPDQFKNEAKAWQGLADSYRKVERYEEAITVYLRAIALYQRVPNPAEVAECSRRMADCYYNLGQYEKALENYQRITLSFHTQADTSSEADCIQGQADCYLNLKLYREAYTQYSSATGLYHRLKAWQDEAYCHFNGSRCLEKLLRYMEALSDYQKAFDGYSKVSDRSQMVKCLLNRGQVFQKMNSLSEAQEEYLRAIKLCQDLDDPTCLAGAYVKLANLLELLAKNNVPKAGEYVSNAENYYLLAKEIYAAESDSQGIASCYDGWGGINFEKKNYAQAIEHYNRALGIYMLSHETEDEASCRLNLGSSYYNLTNFQEALRLYLESLAIYRNLNLPGKIANCLSKSGHTYLHMKPPQLDQARRDFQEAISIYLTQPEPDLEGQAYCYRGTGDVYLEQGQHAEAKTQYLRALELYGRFIDLSGKAYCKTELGDADVRLANFKDALGWYQDALHIFAEIKDSTGTIYTNVQIGKLYYYQDQYEKSLNTFENALRLAKSHHEKQYQISCYINMGNIYNEVEDFDSAEVVYQQGLNLTVALKDTTNMGICYVNLSNIYYNREDYVKAQQFCESALTIARRLGESTSLVISLINMGNIFCRRELIESGIKCYDEAFQISEHIRYPKGLGLALNNLASVDIDRGRYSEALNRFNQAERILVENQIRKVLYTVYANKGVLYEKFEQYDRALMAYESAIQIVEDIRAGLKRDRLLRSFIESKADLYDRTITLLLTRLNNLEKAAYYLEKSKHPNLQETYRRLTLASGDQRLIALWEQYERVKQKMLRDQAEYDKIAVDDDKSSKEVISQSLTMSRHTADSLAQYLGADVQIRVKLLQGLQPRIPSDAIFILYHPSQSGLFIFLVTNTNFQVRRVSVPKDTLYAKIRQYRDVIHQDIENSVQRGSLPTIDSWQDRNVQSLSEVMVKLYDYLIKPIEKSLADKKMLTFIPSELLYYLPIHALAQRTSAGGLEFVIERWQVNYLSSISFLNIVDARNRSRQRNYSPQIVALANADGTLPETEEEVRQIQLFAPDAEVYLGAQATEEIAIQKARTCSILILSTHCFLNNNNPYQTFVKLAPSGAYDGKWLVSEVQEISCSNLDLVILSACATAIGGENPGVEICNFVESFGTAGASSIIATLWPVSDVSSKELMMHFYRGYLKQHLSKVDALRQAQLQLLSNPKYRHPLAWAPFILIGDWR